MAKKHRVYCTYFPDGRYYIGYSCKTDKQFENYYGSSSIVKTYLQENARHVGQPVSEILEKEVIVEYDKRAPAKMQEFLLQWQQRHDDNCINDSDGDEVCDELEISGCTEAEADKYDTNATDEDGTCIY